MEPARSTPTIENSVIHLPLVHSFARSRVPLRVEGSRRYPSAYPPRDSRPRSAAIAYRTVGVDRDRHLAAVSAARHQPIASLHRRRRSPLPCESPGMPPRCAANEFPRMQLLASLAEPPAVPERAPLHAARLPLSKARPSPSPLPFRSLVTRFATRRISSAPAGVLRRGDFQRAGTFPRTLPKRQIAQWICGRERRIAESVSRKADPLRAACATGSSPS